ncbi:hypothetical protein [Singulisphaera sp. PoT]|uniref:hypothetical protein n=1 Tax=Singulisphaera sp. PoT TaxID=3411797 RepID=UPI003BF50671
MLSLGPMPESVRKVVRRLIAENRPENPATDERLNGLLLSGGPTGCCYLDANGRAWNCDFWAGTIELVPDGPMKVGMVVIAAARHPEFAAWLPPRPAGATDCRPCRGSGWPFPRLQCPECHGMGWVA